MRDPGVLPAEVLSLAQDRAIARLAVRQATARTEEQEGPSDVPDVCRLPSVTFLSRSFSDTYAAVIARHVDASACMMVKESLSLVKRQFAQ